MLRFFRGYLLEQIAGALSISLSAAKMRLYRALVQFRTCYVLLASERDAVGRSLSQCTGRYMV